MQSLNQHVIAAIILAGAPWVAVAESSSAKAPSAELVGAQWVWAGNGTSILARENLPGPRAFLRKEFDLPSEVEVRSAKITLVADDRASAWINGEVVGTCNSWSQPAVVDVAQFLKPGKNIVAIQADNTDTPGDPGGVLGKLAITLSDGTRLDLATDATWSASLAASKDWKTSSFDATGWPKAAILGPVGLVPWGILFPGAEDALPKTGPGFLNGSDDKQLSLLGDILRRHFTFGVSCTLWDPWLPQAQLWAAVGTPEYQRLYRDITRLNLVEKMISPAGYVSMQQHRGLGNPDGWPFPLWTQGGGIGWHFSLLGCPFGPQFGINRSAEATGWTTEYAQTVVVNEKEGWCLSLDAPNASITSPAFEVASIVVPWVRLEWRATGLDGARPRLQWTTVDEPEFSEKNSLDIAGIPDGKDLVFSMLPIHRVPGSSPVTRFRISFGNRAPAKVNIAALFTVTDSRKPITNPDFVVGCADFAAWTQDIPFLRDNIGRMRFALNFALNEFRVAELGFARIPWPGHSGASGLKLEGGTPKQVPGQGIGNNYFDLVPFGGDDFYVTVRVHLALRRMIEIENLIRANPQWNIPGPQGYYAPGFLETVLAKVESVSRKHFWNAEAGRFAGWINDKGEMRDYGFTVVNLEAIAGGLPTGEQSREIFAWLDGTRDVVGDTSQGADIYHWRLSPRMTTRRNIESYSYVWIAPHQIPWGDQIQDGGAVLGFSYYDILARLRVLGPDAAWKRLSEVLDWYREVQEAGGYRTYYETQDGTLQGGGTAGGIGVDVEFYESVMIPSVMIYGFLGVSPAPDQITFAPRLPTGWPHLTVTGVIYGDHTFDVTADPKKKTVSLKVTSGDPQTLRASAAEGWTMQRTPSTSPSKNK